MDRFFPTVCVVVSVLLVLSVMPMAYAGSDRSAVIAISFPVAGSYTYGDTYDEIRDGGSRRHQGTDIFGEKGQPIHAAAGGTVCMAPGIDEPMPAYGYIVRVCTGNVVYSYVHLNNDTPGTDDGKGGPALAYAPGIREGVAVSRGQLLGYMGDSGNAEDTPTHLHFSIYDVDMIDPDLSESPWRQHYLNPYPSLRAAEAAGRIPGSAAMRLGDMGDDVQAWQRDLNTVIDADLTTDGQFGPATAEATRHFQQDRGLTVDGVVGPATRAAMDARLDDIGGTVSKKQVADQGQPEYGGRLLRLQEPMMQGGDVRSWQQQMHDRGWRAADGTALQVDGWFGPDSERAARLFQQEKGLTVDGVVGPSTWAATFS